MQNHFYRTLLIFAALVIAIINIVPTVGWYTVYSPEKRLEMIELWNQQDYERAGEDTSFFTRYGRGIKRWSEFDVTRTITLGLDLQGGVHMVVGFDPNEIPEDSPLTVEEVQQILLNTIQNRVTEFESSEPTIQALGTNQVQVQLPGEHDVARAQKLVLKAGALGFHIGVGPQETDEVLIAVDEALNNGLIPFLQDRSYSNPNYTVPQEYFPRVKQDIDALVERDAKAREAGGEGVIPADRIIAFSPPPPAYDKDADYSIYVLEKEAGVTGEYIRSAVARQNPESPGQWMILFEFNSEGGKLFGDLTGANVDRPLAIVLDGNVASAPNINERIGASGSISGNFTHEEAQDVAIALNSGAMPVTPREDYSGIVGRTIGGEDASKGVIASLLGLIIVMIFTALYYRVGGIVADISLIVNAILLLGAFAYFGVTLTLPGIAGLILTIGMAVDSNVLIFERMREEAAQGKSLSACIEGGFARASSAIWDANVTTLIAAIVLTQFGTGPVQGFAVALSIGVCTSVFAALVVTRAVLEFIAERKLVSKITMMSLISNDSHFEFMGRRRAAALASLVCIAAGIGYFSYRGSENFGVDFTNGTNLMLTVNSDKSVGVNDVRQALTEAGFTFPVVQSAADSAQDIDSNRFLIRIGDTIHHDFIADGAQNPASADTVEEGAEVVEVAPVENADGAADSGESEKVVPTVAEDVQSALAHLSTVTDGEKVTILRAETVGPAVGDQLRRDAVNAIFFSLLFIMLYLIARFDWKFSVAAAVALLHDVLIVIAVLAVMQREISIPVIAALLTIIGYSLNDTIIVFDRVREDLALSKSRGASFLELLNESLNRTLSRTLLTSMTTLFVVIVLYFFGGDEINDFALALFAGIIVGTYSSIFVASPVVNYLRAWAEKRAAAADA